MTFRSIVAEPHEVTKLTAAFDAAWRGVYSVETIEAATQQQARNRLAAIILVLWQDDPDQALAARAVDLYFHSGPTLVPPADAA